MGGDDATVTGDSLAVALRCFQEYPVHVLESTLRQRCSEVLSACFRPTAIATTSTGHRSILHRCCNIQLWFDSLAGIDWTCLCDHYDSIHLRKGDDQDAAVTAKNSPLCLMLSIFTDPTCCTPVALAQGWDVLVKHFVHYSGNSTSNSSTVELKAIEKRRSCQHEWRPSHIRILQFLNVVLSNRYPFANNGPFLDEHFQVQKLVRSVEAAETVLRLLCYWFREASHRRTVWLSKSLELIGVLDRLEGRVTLQRETWSTQSSNTSKDKLNSRKRSLQEPSYEHVALLHRQGRAMNGRATWRYLHGELSDDQEQTFVAKLSRQNSAQRAVKIARLGAATGTCTAPVSSQLQALSHCCEDDDKANKLVQVWKAKASCIKFVLQSCPTIHKSWSMQKPIPRCDATAAVMDMFLNTIPKFPNSPTLRFCSVLLAQTGYGSEPGALSSAAPLTARSASGDDHAQLYQTMVKEIWSKAQTSSTKQQSATFLALYCEWITECSYFDDPVQLYTAMYPLICQLQRMVQQTSSPSTGDDRASWSHRLSMTRHYLQCLAFLLSRRGTMLLLLPKQQPQRDELTALFAQLSLKFDQRRDWIHENVSESERHKRLAALQMAGILRMVEKDEWSTCTSIDRVTASQDGDEVVLPSSGIKLETVARQIEPWISHPLSTSATDLFSKYSPTNACPPKADCDKSSAPSKVLAYVNDDLLLRIFSFLNYKRLARMRRVCSSWKELADGNRIWQPLYQTRYGTHGMEGVGDNMVSQRSDWKRLFRERWQAERDIRFRVCSVDPSWKVRLCSHVGCLAVLATPASMERHGAAHMRQHIKEKQDRLKQRATRDNSKRRQTVKASSSPAKPRQKAKGKQAISSSS